MEKRFVFLLQRFSLAEGSLEVKLPTIWTDEKQRWEESEKRREEKKKEYQKDTTLHYTTLRCIPLH